MRTEAVRLPWSGQTYSITRPASIDDLLDLVAEDPEQNLPYWAEIWPSGLALADAIEQQPDVVRGRRTLEVGCGLGLTAIAALRSGSLLTVTDYAREALDLCRRNCQENAGLVPAALAINWRDEADIDRVTASGQFPVVLAADVLYERRDIEPLLRVLPRVLAPGGVVWLAEPGRPVAADFIALAEELGWRRRSTHHAGPWPEESDAGVEVGLHELRPPD